MERHDLELARRRFESGGTDSNGRAHGRLKFDALKKATYVALIRQGLRRTHAAELIGVSHAAVTEHMKRFSEFEDAVSEAEMARVDEVEEALFETALNGNVVAQQTVLFNRRPDQWADRSLLRSRLEAISAGVEADEERAATSALDSLRGKLGELRERLATPTAADEEVREPAASAG